MEKNIAGQKWIVFAFNRTTNSPLTGDALNITANLRIDGGIANPVDDINPTELEDGYYVFDLTQAETNGDLLLIAPVSTTTDIQVIGVPGTYKTVAPNSNALIIEPDGDIAKVTLVETTTTNTDMRGTDSVPINPVLTNDARLNNLDATISSRSSQVSQDVIDTVVDAIKAVTDLIPNSGAMTSIAQDSTVAKETTLIARSILSAAYATLVNQTAIEGKIDTVQIDLDNPDQYKADVSLLALEATLQEMEGATFNTATDSLEAIRDRGDVAWLTGAGGSAPTAEENATAVWNFTTRTLTSFGTLISSIWSNVARTLTAGTKDAEIDAIKTVTDNIPDSGSMTSIAKEATKFNPTIDTVARVTLVDTTTINTDMRGTDGAATEAKQDIIDTNVDSILTDTGTTIPDQITALNNISTAEVNAEVVDALSVDTYAEPGKEAPASTTSLATKIGYLYKFLRNKKDSDATTTKLYNDAGTIVDQQSTHSGDDTLVTEEEWTIGS